MVIANLTKAQLKDITRATQRPTAMLNTFGPHRIQEVILAVFNRFACTSVDLEALIHFVLREFNVGPDSYVDMRKTVKAHILKNFAIEQGAPLHHTEMYVRRVTVLHTIETHED